MKRTPSVHDKDNDGGDDCDDNNAHLVNSVMILMMNMTKENYKDNDDCTSGHLGKRDNLHLAIKQSVAMMKMMMVMMIKILTL